MPSFYETTLVHEITHSLGFDHIDVSDNETLNYSLKEQDQGWNEATPASFFYLYHSTLSL